MYFKVAAVCLAAAGVSAVVVRILEPGMAENLVRALSLAAGIGGSAMLFLAVAQWLAPLEAEQSAKSGADAAGESRPPGRKAA